MTPTPTSSSKEELREKIVALLEEHDAYVHDGASIKIFTANKLVAILTSQKEALLDEIVKDIVGWRIPIHSNSEALEAYHRGQEDLRKEQHKILEKKRKGL